jgi:uncharacterized protein YgbK (DUF1537 family)
LDRYLILADDLTGAADAAVALAGSALEAQVILDFAAAARATAKVMSVDLNTRAMAQADAAATVVRATAAWIGSGRQVFKKVDSMLRGHIGAELAALCRGLRAAHGQALVPPLLCIVAPAHPTLGRTVEGGRLSVHGVPAAAQAVPLADDLASFGLACAALDVATLRSSPPQALSSLMESVAGVAAPELAPALVCDALTVHDMQLVVDAARRARVTPVWVGSGGLAQALAAQHEVCAGDVLVNIPVEIPATQAHEEAHKSLAFVVGSFSPVARQQIRALVDTGEVTCVALSINDLLNAQAGNVPGCIDALLATGRDLVLCVDPDLEVRPELTEAVARGLAAVVAPRVDRLAALVCCGGDTSRALLVAMRIQSLCVHRSTETGSTHARSLSYPDLPMILKAGAFGDAELLVRLRSQLVSAHGYLPAPSSLSSKIIP